MIIGFQRLPDSLNLHRHWTIILPYGEAFRGRQDRLTEATISTMDVRYINPFISSLKYTFTTMVRVPIAVGKPAVRTAAVKQSDKETVCAMLEMSGSVQGKVAMRFPSAIVVNLLKSFSNGTVNKLDADALDGLGEIANVVVGNAKRQFPGENNRISTPRIAKDGFASFSILDSILVVPIASSVGTFWLEVQLKRSDTKAKSDGPPCVESPVFDNAAVDVLLKTLLAARDCEGGVPAA